MSPLTEYIKTLQIPSCNRANTDGAGKLPINSHTCETHNSIRSNVKLITVSFSFTWERYNEEIKIFLEILKIVPCPELYIFKLRHGNCLEKRQVSTCTNPASGFLHPTNRGYYL